LHPLNVFAEITRAIPYSDEYTPSFVTKVRTRLPLTNHLEDLIVIKVV